MYEVKVGEEASKVRGGEQLHLAAESLPFGVPERR